MVICFKERPVRLCENRFSGSKAMCRDGDTQEWAAAKMSSAVAHSLSSISLKTWE